MLIDRKEAKRKLKNREELTEEEYLRLDLQTLYLEAILETMIEMKRNLEIIRHKM